MTDRLADQFVKRKSGVQPMVLLSKTLADLEAGRSSIDALQPREEGTGTVIELYFPVQKTRKGQHKAASCEWNCGGLPHPESGRVCRLCKELVPKGPSADLDILVAEAHIKKDCTAISSAERRTLWKAFRAVDEEALTSAKRNKQAQTAEARETEAGSQAKKSAANIEELHKKTERGLAQRYWKERKEKTPVDMSVSPEPVTEEEIYRAARLASRSQIRSSDPPTHERNTRNAFRHRTESSREHLDGRRHRESAEVPAEASPSKKRRVEPENPKEKSSTHSKAPTKPSQASTVTRDAPSRPSVPPRNQDTAPTVASSRSVTPARAVPKPVLLPTPASLPKDATTRPAVSAVKTPSRHRAASDVSRALRDAMSAVPAISPSKLLKRKTPVIVVEDIEETDAPSHIKREEQEEGERVKAATPTKVQRKKVTDSPAVRDKPTADKAKSIAPLAAKAAILPAVPLPLPTAADVEKVAPLPPLPLQIPTPKYNKHMKTAFPVELQPFAAFLVRSGFKDVRKMKRKIGSPEYLRFLMIRMGQTFRRLGLLEAQCRLEFAIRTVLFPESLVGLAEPSPDDRE